MRTIKFRSWDGKQFIPVCINAEGKPCVIVYPGQQIIQDNCQQFTGLKDKNGKEIYEGDVVKSDVGLCEVEWIGSGLSLHTLPRESSRSIFSVNYHECEVIGNIFENKDLLK